MSNQGTKLYFCGPVKETGRHLILSHSSPTDRTLGTEVTMSRFHVVEVRGDLGDTGVVGAALRVLCGADKVDTDLSEGEIHQIGSCQGISSFLRRTGKFRTKGRL